MEWVVGREELWVKQVDLGWSTVAGRGLSITLIRWCRGLRDQVRHSLVYFFAQGLEWPDTLYAWMRKSGRSSASALSGLGLYSAEWSTDAFNGLMESSEGGVPEGQVIPNGGGTVRGILLNLDCENALAYYCVSPK